MVYLTYIYIYIYIYTYIYIYGLLESSLSEIGYYMGEICVGPLIYADYIYADDIVLLAPSARAMRSLLSFCANYATEYKISLLNTCFNSTAGINDFCVTWRRGVRKVWGLPPA